MKVLSDFVPEFDATVVSKLKTARAILLGKLNLAEGAMVGYHRDFDIPVNPWEKNFGQECHPAGLAWQPQPACVRLARNGFRWFYSFPGGG